VTGPAPRGRVFLLSPANCGGERAQLVFREQAEFDLALRLRSREGVMLGEVMSFLSGLYFRGKLTYALTFARPPAGVDGTLVITPNEGLLAPYQHVRLPRLRKFATVNISENDSRYTRPLQRDARRLLAAVGPDCEVVLLGSVATGKYVDILLEVFGERLLFPFEFVGRGDMSRGGLMLRCVDAGRELTYVPVSGAVRHGPRPPRLAPRRWLAPRR
jgi:hypothetical protein